MDPETLNAHIDDAHEALESFLSTLFGQDVSIDRADAAETTWDAVQDDVQGGPLIESEGPFAVDLDDEWVPVIGEAMLGEEMEIGDEGVQDLLSEVAAQAFGTLRNQLAQSDLELPDYSLDALISGDATPDLRGALWDFPFTVATEGRTLNGRVLLKRSSPSASSSTPASDDEEAAETDPAPSTTSQAETSSSGSDKVEVSPASFSELGDESLGGNGDGDKLELLSEIEIEVSVELGRRELPLADVLQFTNGSVIELEKLVGEPLHIYANGRFIAEGEAVVVDEKFGIRITKLAPREKRGGAFL